MSEWTKTVDEPEEEYDNYEKEEEWQREDA